MKWSFVIQQKLKAAFLLTGIMLAIILGTLVSRQNIKGINKSFSSIYQDRLLPTTTIIYMTENLYGKRLTLERYLLSGQDMPVGDLKERLQHHNAKIDSLVTSFEGTYLVDQEAKSLVALKNRMNEYALLEKMILNFYTSGHYEEGKKLFEGAGASTFQSTIMNLNELTTIQSSVGQELIKESKSDIANVDNILLFQISMAVVIGLIILAVIQSAQIIKHPGGKGGKEHQFNLN
ncbi:hypothetical protein DYBT9275_03276 [Dyadobacter sp. CECT 9275]|uniref:Chemotaxis methyl-accepting receptor HlyB-like 4HB MCP domain-containing protein n=2 Tax=Dyadobacter helix TaxID=2822344 RepID=A0A916JHB9_9BACT|nr:hypothetical protein DYBT9275_03276 [Dyadobacter sp. CECT 9275]